MRDRLAGAGGPGLLLVGTDHRCSPLELRECVAYSGEEVEEAMVHLLAREEIAETVVLSTCNRTEVYVQPRDGAEAFPAVLDLVFRARAPEVAEEGRLYIKRHSEAARHALAVASGLESMVLGEPEILGQVRQAAARADGLGASGAVLRKLLQFAHSAGRRARTETGINAGAVSLGYSTVELARNIFNRLDAVRLLVVGAGETARTVARNLSERGVTRLMVTNRSREHAEQLAAEHPGCEVIPFDERASALDRADVVVAATGAHEPVLTTEACSTAMRRRPHGPLLVVDLGVPRNVEPSAARVENLFLHDIDALDRLIQRNLRRRRREVPKVEEIVDAELVRFERWFRGLAVEPVIAGLQRQAESIRKSELAAARRRFPDANHEDLDLLTRALVRKILHHPSRLLRKGDQGLHRLDLVRELFQLESEDGDESS